jgi:hypothetical protein
MDNIAAIVSGTRKGFAKYNPAKTAKKIMNMYAALETDVGIELSV